MGRWLSGRALLAAGVCVIAASGSAGNVRAQDKLRVIVFPGLSNLAQFAAESRGFYKKRGLQVELIPTPTSDELRNGLAEGRYDIAHAAVDNAVAQKAYATDARLDMAGFRNVLRLRAEMLGTWGGTPPAPDRYLDLSYYHRALEGL